MGENILSQIDTGLWDLKETQLSDLYKKKRRELEAKLEKKIKGVLCGLKKV